jgi:hypothetical protein
MSYPQAAWERGMTVQEVILKAFRQKGSGVVSCDVDGSPGSATSGPDCPSPDARRQLHLLANTMELLDRA